MLLQLCEVVEWVGLVKFAGVNNAHKQVAHTSSVEGLNMTALMAV